MELSLFTKELATTVGDLDGGEEPVPISVPRPPKLSMILQRLDEGAEEIPSFALVRTLGFAYLECHRNVVGNVIKENVRTNIWKRNLWLFCACSFENDRKACGRFVKDPQNAERVKTAEVLGQLWEHAILASHVVMDERGCEPRAAPNPRPPFPHCLATIFKYGK